MEKAKCCSEVLGWRAKGGHGRPWPAFSELLSRILHFPLIPILFLQVLVAHGWMARDRASLLPWQGCLTPRAAKLMEMVVVGKDDI